MPEESQRSEGGQPRGARRLTRRISATRRGVMLYFAILGPGLIAAIAGNDAGGIAVYSHVGAVFGYQLLWVLAIIAVSLIVIQLMSARMGAVTGKGLADLIREEFGIRWTAIAMLALLVANGGTTIAEFAGIAASAELLGISRYIAVPLMGLVVWLVVVRASYRTAERVFLILSAAFGVYFIAPFMTHPDWGYIARSTIAPSISVNADFLMAIIILVGTTITPYMQLFVQSAVVDKGVTIRDYPFTRLDVIFGSIFAIAVAAFIIVTTGTILHPAGIAVETAEDAATALAPLVGQYATILFAIGLFGASMLAACVLPLSTAYALSEAFGWERGVSKTFGEAPVFNGLYTGLIVLSVLVVLIPGLPLIGAIITSQFIDGLLLPVLLIFMLKLSNSREVMGNYVNGPVFNVIAWLTVIIIIAISVVLLIVLVVGWMPI
ncbi:MAG: Nramp family divalent metal transporter [Dehalococcoidia bacterium]|nr:Nramp family divalent metal transporter [Dehalococcoidia bacterium]